MKLSDGLFLRCARKVAEGFPEIFYGEHIIDNTCMQLVMNPYQYDTLLLENLYGDIVSDLCAGLVGGLGLVPGANLGHECAIFEAVHGSAPDIAGKDIANPTALLQSAVLMLRHLDEMAAADKVHRPLESVYAERKTLTRDVGGTAGTTQFADAVLAAMESAWELGFAGPLPIGAGPIRTQSTAKSRRKPWQTGLRLLTGAVLQPAAVTHQLLWRRRAIALIGNTLFLPPPKLIRSMQHSVAD